MTKGEETPLSLLIAVSAWIMWPLLAIPVAVAFRALFDAIDQHLHPNPQARPITVTTDSEGPRVVRIILSQGGVEVRPELDEHVVIHGDGSQQPEQWVWR